MEPITMKHFRPEQHAVQRHFAQVPEGTTLKDIQKPDFWVNVARRCTGGDRIVIQSDDLSIVAELVVAYVNGPDMRVLLVHGKEFTEKDKPEMEGTGDNGYDVKLRGPKKWCIIKIETGDEIMTGIPTKAEAYKELEQYLTMLNS